jgi:hypothetical protein
VADELWMCQRRFYCGDSAIVRGNSALGAFLCTIDH